MAVYCGNFGSVGFPGYEGGSSAEVEGDTSDRVFWVVEGSSGMFNCV